MVSWSKCQSTAYRLLEQGLFSPDGAEKDTFCVYKDVGEYVKIVLEGQVLPTSEMIPINTIGGDISALVSVFPRSKTPEKGIDALKELVSCREQMRAKGYIGTYEVNDEVFEYRYSPTLITEVDLEMFVNALAVLDLSTGK